MQAADSWVLPVSRTHRAADNGMLTRLRHRPWFRWLALFALLCAIGLYSLDANHQHRSQASELLCPVCHVIAHGALDILSPTFNPLPSVGVGYFLNVSPHQASFPPHRFAVTPQSRAPPAR